MIATQESIRLRPFFNPTFWFRDKIANILSVDVDKADSELTLSERIAKYGKIRFLVVCDENLGRSPMLASALRKRVQVAHLEDMVEVMSAGTDVKKEKSWQKYGGGAHPQVIMEMKDIPGIDIENHRVTQFKLRLVNPNTILIVLNDINKLPRKAREKCFSVIDCGTDDPCENQNYSLRGNISEFHENVFFFTMKTVWLLKEAIERDSLEMFRVEHRTPLENYGLYLQ